MLTLQERIEQTVKQMWSESSIRALLQDCQAEITRLTQQLAEMQRQVHSADTLYREAKSTQDKDTAELIALEAKVEAQAATIAVLCDAIRAVDPPYGWSDRVHAILSSHIPAPAFAEPGDLIVEIRTTPGESKEEL